MSDAEDLDHAIELWRDAYRRQMAGDLDEAITLYRRSLAVRPTAEAHTFLGWTYSFQGRFEDAESLRATYDFVREHGLGGVALFPLAYGNAPLWDDLRSAFSRPRS